MKSKYIFLTIIAIILYGLGNYYAGSRTWAACSSTVSAGLVGPYWAATAFLGASYFVGRLGAVYFPGDLSDGLIWLGAYWAGAVFYLILLWGITDLLFWVGRYFDAIPYSYNHLTPLTGGVVLALTALIVSYGIQNSRRSKVREYCITIYKSCSLPSTHIVLIADLHLGLLVGRGRLEKLVTEVNSLAPDMVVLAGDILDENVGAVLDNNMPPVFWELKPPLGLYACLGSHEYILSHTEKALYTLSAAGITILRDRYVKIADAFYLAGRDDYFRERILTAERQSLATVLAGCDKNLPVILLDHQPTDLDEAIQEGVDLQLSGHTHHGQLIPCNLITSLLFKKDWGYWRNGSFQLIVSCGWGTWGPPLRVGSASEIVSIKINFLPPRRLQQELH